MTYPIIPLPRRRMFPQVIGEDQPTIQMGEQPVVSPQEQIGQNAVNAIPVGRMSQPEPVIAPQPAMDEQSADLQPAISRRMATSVPYEPPAMPDHSQDAPRGFWGNVKHRLEHAGKGALMGGLGGAILGGISPRMVDQTEYEQRTLPEYNRQWGARENALDTGIENRSRIGALTDIDPETGAPTGPAQRRIAIQEETASRNKAADQDRDTNMAIRAQAEWDQRHPGELYPEHVTRALPNLKGERAPKLAVRPGKAYIKTEMGADGTEYGLTPEGQWEATRTTEGTPFKRFQKPDELTANQRRTETRQDEQDQRADEIKFEDYKTKASEEYAKSAALERKARQMRKMVGKTVDGYTVTEEDAAAAEEEVRAQRAVSDRLNQQAKQHGRYMERRYKYKYKEDKQGNPAIEPPQASSKATAGQPAPHSVALQLYQDFVRAHPDRRAEARAKFLKQRGIDPEAQ